LAFTPVKTAPALLDATVATIDFTFAVPLYRVKVTLPAAGTPLVRPITAPAVTFLVAFA
jgi:hypothetical protein